MQLNNVNSLKVWPSFSFMSKINCIYCGGMEGRGEGEEKKEVYLGT